jgi:hypothetical protein
MLTKRERREQLLYTLKAYHVPRKKNTAPHHIFLSSRRPQMTGDWIDGDVPDRLKQAGCCVSERATPAESLQSAIGKKETSCAKALPVPTSRKLIV